MPTQFADGRFVAEEQQPLDTNAAGAQTSPVFARLASGGFVATWVDNGTVVGQRFDAFSGKIGSEFVVAASTRPPQAVGLAGRGSLSPGREPTPAERARKRKCLMSAELPPAV